MLTKFYHVSNNAVLLYGLVFAVGNLAGPLLLGHLFDTLGRKKMIDGYALPVTVRSEVAGHPEASPRSCWMTASASQVW